MGAYAAAAISSLWLGILTSISPCPLATNIAAISYLSRESARTRTVIGTGLFYAFGRMLAYVLLGALIVWSLVAIPSASFFLQRYVHLILGPLLIVVGMLLLELISVPFPSFANGERLKNRIGWPGMWGSLGLGFVFALAFCPVSAALFFGSLIPLAVTRHSPVVLTSIFGFGSALPVLIFAVALVAGSRVVARWYNRITAVEKWLRIGTGILIILIGIYMCLTYVFELF